MIDIIIIPPRPPYTGNLLWVPEQAEACLSEIYSSMELLRGKNYWLSLYPEGDGITFSDQGEHSRDDKTVIEEFTSAFGWATLTPQKPKNEEPPKRSPLPTMGYEENSIVEKSFIGLAQLEDAITLYLSERRLSAITLAGAADGVFSGLLNQAGQLSAAQATWKSIEDARKSTGLPIAGDRTEKEAHWEWNEWRNRLKHHSKDSDLTIEFNVFDQAYYSIVRAKVGADLLGLEVSNWGDFESWNMKNIFGVFD